ncbi:hypothetical protein BDP27DRAFT_1175433, partial [Rhodocollybia butyracea]
YSAFASVVEEYPAHGGALFQTYNDLKLGKTSPKRVSLIWFQILLSAQQWRDVEVKDLGQVCKRGAIQGRRPKTTAAADLLLYVVPCTLAESISMVW